MQELRSIFRRALIFTLFSVILLTAAQAQANIIESWDEFASGTIIDNGSTVNGITYKYVPDTEYPRTGVNFMVTNSYGYTSETNTLGVTSGSGVRDYPYFTYDGVQFVFSQPIRTFGIDISTYAPNAGTFMAITNQDEVAYSVVDYFPDLSAGQFLGFTSDEPFTSVTITYNSDIITNQSFIPYGWALDTMRVPLPPSLLLLGSGLAGLGLLRLRKRFPA